MDQYQARSELEETLSRVLNLDAKDAGDVANALENLMVALDKDSADREARRGEYDPDY